MYFNGVQENVLQRLAYHITLLCALVLYMNRATWNLDDKFLRNFSWQFSCSLGVFDRNLLRESRRRNIFSFFVLLEMTDLKSNIPLSPFSEHIVVYGGPWWFHKQTYLYIIGHYKPTVWIRDLVYRTTYVVYVNFMHGIYSLKATPNVWEFFEKLFMAI